MIILALVNFFIYPESKCFEAVHCTIWNDFFWQT